MKKRFIFLALITSISFQNLFAQLDSEHYLPPLKQVSSGAAILQQAVYLSTPASEGTFNVEVFIGTSGASTTFSLSHGAPVIIDAASIGLSLANGDNDITLVSNARTGMPLTDARLRFIAPKKFYVNYRGRSNSQAGSLTSKGKAALGRDFRWGGIANNASNANLTTSLGMMATDPGVTTVTVSGYDPGCIFRTSTGIPAASPDVLTINLNQYETYVIEAPKNTTNANRDGWLGATVSSNKNIVVSVGGLNVGVNSDPS